MQNQGEWLTSKEVEKELRLSGCHLMHLREQGKLRFKKKGNAFLYLREDVERQRKAVLKGDS